ncbi:DbpA RNA binding domain-containing protein [Nocardioides convexus]|uniref:DbpA RNA binding domain-containing protein n=1 Tax=Nocardioides convexus TaxID=2712224 RepID=UPI002418347F|nr:DbpA RNA binding domain-containing protein [Nocardioides convexus]
MTRSPSSPRASATCSSTSRRPPAPRWSRCRLPSVDAINESRLSRFDDQITAALESPSISFFRDVVSHYIKEHDVPEVDVAAALAIVMQGDTPLLLEPEPERPVRAERDRTDRGDHRKRDSWGADDRGERGGRDRAPRGGGNFQAYKIQVGKRHRVEPRQIVGALANEGGLDRRDFGKITIRPDYSIVESARAAHRRAVGAAQEHPHLRKA